MGSPRAGSYPAACAMSICRVPAAYILSHILTKTRLTRLTRWHISEMESALGGSSTNRATPSYFYMLIFFFIYLSHDQFSTISAPAPLPQTAHFPEQLGQWNLAPSVWLVLLGAEVGAHTQPPSQLWGGRYLNVFTYIYRQWKLNTWIYKYLRY